MPDPIRMAGAFVAALALSSTIIGVLGLVFGRLTLARIAASCVAILAALGTGAWILGLLPNFPPREDLDRLMLIVLPTAMVAEVIVAGLDRYAWIPRCIVAAIAAPVLLHGSVYVTDLAGPGSRIWSETITHLLFAGSAVLLMASWHLMNRLAVRKGTGMALTCVAGAVLGSGLVIMLSGYATGGQLGIPLAAALVGCMLASALSKESLPGEIALGVGTVGLFSLVFIGRLYAELTTLNGTLLLAAPLLGWLPELLPTAPRVRVMLRLVLTAAPVVVAPFLAKQNATALSAQPASGTEASIVDEYMSFGKR